MINAILPKQFEPAQQLEFEMGCVDDLENIFGYFQILKNDESELFPEIAFRKLGEWGLNNFYVPRELGGNLESFETLFFLIRTVTRRDLSLAVAHGKNYLGASPVWVAGNDFQKKYLAKIIQENESVSLGLTEKEHGSDLMGNELTFVADKSNSGHLILSGEKWLINNATRCRAITLYGRTNNHKGPKSHSLLLIDKNQIDSNKFQHLNKIKTHGIRSVDISGIAFNNAPISKDYIIGNKGEGLEITLKSLQISRTMCSSLSIGSMDSAFHTVMSFILNRKLYGSHLYDIKFVKENFVKSFLMLLTSEALAITASRCLHVIPEEMNLISSTVKYFVPTVAEKIINNLGNILGARAYLRGFEHKGIYQKIIRDNKLVGLFDGSTIVNLQNMTTELSQVVKRISGDSFDVKKIKTIFDLDQNLPVFNPDKLSLSAKGRSFLTEIMCFSNILPDYNDLPISQNISDKSCKLIENIKSKYWLTEKVDKEKQELLEQYSWLIAITCLMNIVNSNQENLNKLYTPELKACLINSIYKLMINQEFLDQRSLNSIWELMINLYKDNKLFSLFDFSVGKSNA